MNKFLSLLLLLSGMSILAQTPVIDNTFNPSDNGVYSHYIGRYCVMLSDGKLLSIHFERNPAIQSIVRLNSDGSIDNTFAPVIMADFRADKIAVNASNEFVVSCENNDDGPHLKCFNADGTPKSSFASPVITYMQFGENEGYINTVLFQNDGKIMIGGKFSIVNGTEKANLVRLNSDGSIDTSFTGGASSEIYAITKQSDDKYLIGGLFGSVNGVAKKRIARLTSDGTLDTTFAMTGTDYIADQVTEIIVQPDNKILVNGGYYVLGNGQYPSKNICRLNANGSRDTSFNFSFASTMDQYYLSDICLLPDGKILLDGNNKVTRINATGSIDNTFSDVNLDHEGPYLRNNIFYQPDGKVIISGMYRNSAGQTRLGIYRLNTGGSLDLTFNPSAGPNLSYAAQRFSYNNDDVVGSGNRCFPIGLRDGKILLYGNFTSYNDIGVKQIIRLNYDGTVDDTFALGSNISIYPNYNTKIRFQNDGKLLLTNFEPNGFYTSTVSIGTVAKSMIRINANGTYDSTFNLAFDSNYTIVDFEILSSGKILVVGQGSLFGSDSQYKVKRLNANGSVDTGFVSETFYQITSIQIQPDDTVLLLGQQQEFVNPKIYKLNPGGGIDSSFNNNVYIANNFRLQPDGKILVSYLNAWESYYTVSRFNADGSADASFTPIVGDVYNEPFSQFYFTSDNHIIVGSSTNTDYKILTTNGTVLNTFGGQPNYTAASRASLQGCDKIIVCSYYNKIGGAIKTNIARFNLSGAGSISPNLPSGASDQFFTPTQTLADLVVDGSGILWYHLQNSCYVNHTDNRNANDTNDTSLPLSTLLEDGVTYYASQTINGIESTLRLPVTAHTSLGIQDISGLAIKAFPNPARDIVTVESRFPLDHIEVYNLQGQKLSLKTQISGNTATIDLSQLSGGNYFIRLFSADMSGTIKVIKQ